MKRDLDLLRDMLLVIESIEAKSQRVINIETFYHLCSDSYTVSQHIRLLLDSGFIEADGPLYNGDAADFYITRITSSGYDYLDSVRNPGIWAATKAKLQTLGGSATLEIVKTIAIDLVKDYVAGRFQL